MESTTTQARPRTTLISVFGWVMLVVGALTTAVSTINLVLLSWMASENGGELIPAEDLAELPPLFSWTVDNLIPVLGFMIVSSVFMAVAGFGVVRRQNWGRLLSIILLAGSIVGGFVTAWFGMRTSAEMAEDLQLGLVLVTAYNIGLAVLTAALHGWIIWKLRTPAIRSEFVDTRFESHSR